MTIEASKTIVRLPGEYRQAATFIVAASDSLHKERADYVADGVDDQVEIQAAIDALPAYGGTVQLSEGLFSFSSTVNLDDNSIWLRGSGIARAVTGGTKIMLANDSDVNMINISECGCVVSDALIDGNKNNNASGNGIVISAAQNELRNLWIAEVADDAVSSNSNANWLRNLRITTPGNDALCLLENDGLASDIYVVFTGRYGMNQGGSGWIMSNVRFGNTQGDFAVRINGNTNVVSGLRIGNADHHGIYLTSNSRENYISGVCDGAHVGGAPGNGMSINGDNNTINMVFKRSDDAYAIVITGNNNNVSGCSFSGYSADSTILDDGDNNLVTANSGYLGIGEPRTFRKTVNYDDSSPVNCTDVEDGYMVESVFVEVVTSFDDTGPQTLDIGDGGDVDGFLANANINVGAAGYYGIEYDNRGAYLWDSANVHARTKVYTASDTVDCTIGAGNGDGTQGQAIVYVKVTRIGG